MCRVDGLLRFGSRSMVRLPKVYGFATLSRFAIRRSSSDAEVLGALIKAPEFEGPGYDLPTPTAEQLQEWEAFRARLMDRLTQGGQASIPPVDRRPRHGPLLVSEIRVGSYKITTADHARSVMREMGPRIWRPACRGIRTGRV